MALTLLRLSVGVIFVVHGSMKLSNIAATADGFAQMGIPYPDIAVYFAIAGEFGGGLGLVVGFLTRIAALGGLCTMAVAIAFVHAGNGLLAKNGGWEYPLTLLLVTLLFVVRGAGPLSIDAMLRRLRDRRREEVDAAAARPPRVEAPPAPHPDARPSRA